MMPTLTLAWTAEVLIGEKQDLGDGPLGRRFLVPILGGTFEGPRLRGRVLGGGADRQWVRPDGVREFDALYDMRVDDGTVITVRNRVLVDGDDPRTRYARSVVCAQASAGPHAWITRRVLVGTLESLRPAQAAVRVTVYTLD
ncbi:DUF3237 domain-containing protein [Rubrivivax sp. JA1024]|nr:DUF3237 domain-containing protein [Rubrivivax sp. JA1024]